MHRRCTRAVRNDYAGDSVDPGSTLQRACSGKLAASSHSGPPDMIAVAIAALPVQGLVIRIEFDPSPRTTETAGIAEMRAPERKPGYGFRGRIVAMCFTMRMGARIRKSKNCE